MPIYYGSNQIAEITNSSNGIDEVYYGKDLVFSSGFLPIWKFSPPSSSGSYDLFLIGEYGTNGILTDNAFSMTGLREPILYKITSIEGILGASGSKLYLEGSTASWNYRNTVTLNGKIIYFYDYSGASFISTAVLVYQNSKVGDVGITYMYRYTIKSITDTTITYTDAAGGSGNKTGTRDTTYYKKWSKDGVK